jgi:hypothetical protein
VHCIFCRNEKPERLGEGEHVIPLSLGGSWTIERVCVDCDNELGSRYDAGLAKLTVIEDRRAQLGLVGHSRRPPNRIRDGLAQPVSVNGEPARRMNVQMNDHGRIMGLHTIPFANFNISVGADGAPVIGLEADQVGIDPRDVPKAGQILRRFLREALAKSGVVITADEETRVIADCVSRLERVDVDTTVEVPVPTRTGGHLGSMLKCAYEAAWYWLGETWLDDPQAVNINRHLRGDDNATVQVNTKQGELRAFDVMPLLQANAHVIALFQSEQGTGIIDIQLFDKVGVSFIVTDDIAAYRPPLSHAIVMDAVSGTHYFTSSGSILAH